MSKKRFFSLMLAMAMAVSVISGCGSTANNNATQSQAPSASAPAQASPSQSTAPSPSVSPSPEASAAKKDTLVVVTENEPSKISTQDHNILASDYINKLTHNGLFKRNMELKPVPNLVESYEAVSDTEWVMTIKKGIKFHDGTDLTSEDVKATLLWTQGFPEMKLYTSSIADVEIVDDYTVKILTNGPKAQLLDDLASHANYIVPSELIDSGNDFNENPIGAGPYKFVSWSRGEVLYLEAFEDYFDAANKAKIPKIEWRVVPEAFSRTIALQTGEADLIIEVASNDVPRLRESENCEVIAKPGTGYFFLMINNEVAPFDNVLVRKAINAAIDKEAIVAVALEGLAAPGITQTPSVFPETGTENTDTYDPEKALQYFAEAGVDPASVDFEIIVTGDETRRAAEIAQANLSEIGVKTSITTLDNATALQMEFAGDYVSAIGSYTTFSFLSYLGGVFHSRQYNASNRTRIIDPKIDEYVDTAGITIDPDARFALLQEASAYVNSLTSLVPLYQNTVRRAFSSNLQNFDVGPSGEMELNTVYWK